MSRTWMNPFKILINSYFLEISLKIFESGLLSQWENYYYHYFGIRIMSLQLRDDRAKPKKSILDYNLILPVFFILLVGFFFAFLAFIGEFFLKNLKTTRKYQRRKINSLDCKFLSNRPSILIRRHTI